MMCIFKNKDNVIYGMLLLTYLQQIDLSLLIALPVEGDGHQSRPNSAQMVCIIFSKSLTHNLHIDLFSLLCFIDQDMSVVTNNIK